MAEGGRKEPSTQGSLASVEAIAGAFANAIRQSLSTAQSEQVRPSGSTSSSARLGSAGTHGAESSRIDLPNTSSRPPPSTAYERASDFRASKRPKFAAPSLFENWRGRRGSQRQKQPPKVISYDRDVILLPSEFKSRGGDISIPRSTKRNKLGQAGLVGKIELNSAMEDAEVRTEICQVFAAPMGLTEEDIKDGHLFPFSYLQRTGAGSRALCVPAVKESFEWNGKKVASLFKAGGFIYLLAGKELPGWQQLVGNYINYI